MFAPIPHLMRVKFVKQEHFTETYHTQQDGKSFNDFRKLLTILKFIAPWRHKEAYEQKVYTKNSFIQTKQLFIRLYSKVTQYFDSGPKMCKW